MAGVVDADTDIAESEAMWSQINREMYPRRPILAQKKGEKGGGKGG
jgi:hypothetical protein